jgi:aldose 1-epimerase
LNAVSRGNPFGLVEGREAHLFTLQSDRLRARVTNYGGVLVSLEMPDRGAAWDHVVLGFDDITGYLENRGSFGALLGRTANRIVAAGS